ncbi:MAG: thioredoxin family protein [Candidatus Omnitrophica bacterium]|nr:thioredoxin family protein [Candidatus Omnitrophota bacterium]
MEIKVVGRWVNGTMKECLACQTLRKRLKEALEELSLDIQIKNCESEEEYLSYGVIFTPLLVINGKVKLMGKVPTKNRIKEIIERQLNAENT